MFTKSGRKLVPISIPGRNDAPTNCNDKLNNHINDQIQIMLDDLVSTDCSMVSLVAEPNAKEDNSPSKSNKHSKTLIKHHNISIPGIDVAKEHYIANDVLLSKPNHLSAHTDKSILSVPPKHASNQMNEALQDTNVFDVSISRIGAAKEHLITNDVLLSNLNHLSTEDASEITLSAHSKVVSNHMGTPQQSTNVFDISAPCIDAANECFLKKPNHLSTAHTDETNPNHLSTAYAGETTHSAHSKCASNQMEKAQEGKNVFDITEISQFLIDSSAIKAKDIAIVSSPSLQTRPQHIQFSKSDPSADLSKTKLPLSGVNDKTSNTLIRKTINGTEYVPYTPKTHVLQRERKIQVGATYKKETVDSAVQSDLKEDEDSENSQSEWINDIIEEYELIENANMYECHICGEVCPSRASNLKHSMTHKESSLLCFRCGRLFLNTSKLLAHEDKMHSEKQLEIKRALRCPKLNCLKAFHSKRQLFDHIDLHGSKTAEQRCTRCQRSFSSSLQLLCHTNRRSCLR